MEDGKNGAHALTPDIVRQAKFEITEPGKSVFHGEADFVELNGIDLWLGGVHLSPNNLWRWDASSGIIMTH